MKNDKAKELATFWAEMAKIDGTMRYRNQYGDWVITTSGPNLHSDLDEWSIVSAKKPIDLSVLIDSGIDCEFSGEKTSTRIDKLEGFRSVAGSYNLKYVPRATGNTYDRCIPRMNHWHSWDGIGKWPLPAGLEIEISWIKTSGIINVRCTRKCFSNDKDLTGWRTGDTIIAFKITGLEENYCWPWELSE